MNLVRRHKDSILRFLNSTSARGYWIAALAATVLIGGIALVLVRAGAPVMNGRPWDVPICLDGAWRVMNGQVPHRDFFSHLGALPYYLARFGMWAGRPSVSALIYGSVLLMCLFAALSFALIRRRTSAGYTFLFTVFLALLVVTPRPLGDPYNFIDHAMIYNRFGDAFLILFGLLVFLSPRIRGPREVMCAVDLGIAGLLCAAMFFTKINYLVFAGGLAGVAVVLGLLRPVQALVVVGSGLCFVGLGLVLSGIPLASILADLRLIAGSQDTGRRVSTLVIQVVKMALPLGALALLAWEADSGQSSAGRLARLRPWLVSAACFLGGAAILASNSQMSEAPLLAVAALFSVELVRRSAPEGPAEAYPNAVRSLFTCGLLMYLLWPTFGADLAAIRHVVTAAVKHDVIQPPALADTNLRDFRFAATSTRTLYSEEYGKWLGEGVELLRRHPNARGKLAVVLYSDPFHLALGLRPPRGGAVCWIWGDWDRGGHLPLPALLGDATHVLTGADCKELKKTYGAEWEALHAEVVEKTSNFVLFKLPSAAGTRSDNAP